MTDQTQGLRQSETPPPVRAKRRERTPTVLQMEAVECGAASLAMILAYYGRYVPLETLRTECGVSRDGSKASNVVRVARQYGLIAKGRRTDPEELKTLSLPSIIFWNFNHFLVVEGYNPSRWYLNDPGMGPRTVSPAEFDESFTGVVLTFEPGPDFKKGGRRPSVVRALKTRAIGLERPLLYAVIAGLILALLGLVIPTFTKIFVDEYLVNEREYWVKPLLWAMGMTLVLQATITWLQQYMLLRLEVKLALSTSSKFLAHILRLPMDFFEQRFAGDIAVRVSSNDRVAQLLSGQLATNLLHVMMAAFFVVVMLQYDVRLTLVGICIACINLAALTSVSRSRKDLNKKLQQDQGKLMGVSISGLQTIETLKSAGGESDFFSKWSGYQAKAVNSEQALGLFSQVLNAIPPLLASLNTMVMLGLGGLLVMEGQLTMGELVAFQSLMTSFATPINNLVALGGQLQEVEADLNRLDDVLNNRPEKSYVQAEKGAMLTDMPAKLSGRLEIRDLTFGYNRLESPLIENFNLSLEPGSRVALVGSSGSGKSTIAKLVCGLHEPWDGQILFDGKQRHEIPRELLTNSLAVVDQDILMFEGTVKENLTLWNQTIPTSRVVRAAEDAAIHDIIAARSKGYESMVEEGGRNFSGGQCQRMEIARSLAMEPTLLILDEATSALDPLTEKTIDNNIRRRGCTCLIVAHRLSTIRDCDEIIVLRNGKVVQRGTHQEMRQVDGPYAHLIADR